MAFLALGFVVFCVGGTLFMRGETNRSPGDGHIAIPLGAHALNTSGVVLMAAGGLLMIAAGIV